jgi:hypothetical protein
MHLNETMVMPLESAEFIMKNSKSVQIVNDGIMNLSDKVNVLELLILRKMFN